jgi:hypothetical protein
MFDEDSDDEMTPEKRKKNVSDAFNKISSKETKLISCAGLQLTSEEFVELVNILKTKNFDTLDLRYNGINTSYIEALQNIIINNSQLKTINLEGNQIDDNAILKLLDNEAVRNRLPNIYIMFAINPYSDKGLIEAAKFMSPHTVGMMTSGAQLKDKELILSIDNAVGKYLRQEDKQGSSLPFNLFLFKQLEEDSQIGKLQKLKLDDEYKDQTQADKLQTNNVITGPARKNS